MLQIADWTSFALPMLIASVSAFVAFETLAQARCGERKVSQGFLAASSLGMGIWLTSLYSIQLLQGLQVRFYSLQFIAGSLFAAIMIAWIGIFALCNSPQRSQSRNILVAVLLVCASVTSDLIHVRALNLNQRVHWHWTMLLCSAVIASGVFCTGFSYEQPSMARRVFGAVLLGATVYGLHRAVMSSIIMTANCHSSPSPWSIRDLS